MSQQETSKGERNAPGLRIVVDFPWDASACMGTGAYSETMVRALAGAAPDSTITLIAPLGTPRRVLLPNVRYASLPTTEVLAEGTRQVALPSFLAAAGADCLFAPASLIPTVKVCPVVATVHDLSFESHSDLYAPGLVAYLRRWFPSTLQAADRIVAISEPVRQDLLFKARVHPARVVVIEQPIRETFFTLLSSEEVDSELAAIGIRAPFLFHVSNLSAHKNMEFGVRVLANFLKIHPHSDLELLFGGGGFGPSAPPDLLAIARSLGIGDRVRYVGKVSDRALKALYQRCEAFLFPSLVEGWGLPVVEARTCGARVLASPHVPSALAEERTPLELTQWVEAIQAPRRQGVDRGTDCSQEAGRRLLETIADAVENHRRVVPAPGMSQGKGEMPAEHSVVAIRGDWHSPSGFGEAARGVCRSLETAGLEPVSVAVPKDRIQDKTLWRREVSLSQRGADLWIHHLPPEQMDLDLPGKHAAYLFWETDRLPAAVSGWEWSNVLSSLDEVWAPSTFVAEVLKKGGVTSPILHLPPPVDSDLFSPGPQRPPPVDLPPGFDPSWTVVLFVGTWDPRKRPDILIRSFSRAFRRSDKALLLIKSYVTGDSRQDLEILGRWTSDARESDAHIRMIPGVLGSKEMADLFRFATAFATASRGEGYCLPAVQAMSSGKPVLAAGWSAFTDYVTVPVNYRVEAVPAEVALPGYAPDQKWAAIDPDDFVRKLRWIHENREEGLHYGRKGRQWVLDHASMSVVGRRLRERVEALSGRVIPPRELEAVK